MNRLYLGDNLPVMRSLPAGCIDLMYLDPPFFTGRTHKVSDHRSVYGARRATPLSGVPLGGGGGEPPGRLGGGGETPSPPGAGGPSLPRDFGGWVDCWQGGLADYLGWLEPRLREVWRLLCRTGNLVVHLDWHAVHYVKVMLDGMFGMDRFVNEIVWCYSIGARSTRHFGRKHDTLLWYGASSDYYFDGEAVSIPRRANSHMRVQRDADGRLFQEKTDRRSGKVYRYEVAAGKCPEDYWTDIESINRADRQRTGYPTQKPEALLRRLVLALSPADGVVGDVVCGSGTTLVAAQRAGRGFVGCDVLPEAVEVARQRVGLAPSEVLRGAEEAPGGPDELTVEAAS